MVGRKRLVHERLHLWVLQRFECELPNIRLMRELGELGSGDTLVVEAFAAIRKDEQEPSPFDATRQILQTFQCCRVCPMDIFKGYHQWSGGSATQQRLGDRRELARPAIEDQTVDTGFGTSETRRCGRLADAAGSILYSSRKTSTSGPIGVDTCSKN